MTPGAHEQRLTAQLLAGEPASSAEAAVRRILAVQGQDPRGFRLAVRARTTGGTAADVDAALTERRSLVVSWLNRGTLHLVAAEDYWWLHPLTTPQLATANARRLEQEGLSEADARRGVDLVVERIVHDGSKTRTELRAALDEAGIRTAGQALVHVLFAASLRHRVVRGPLRNGEHAYVLAETWLGPPPEALDRRDALARLARRYLLGHGPADARDLAVWAGINLGDARLGLDAIAADTVQDADGLIALADPAGRSGTAPPRLLGSFDPVLHGWASRAATLGPHADQVVAGGVFRPFALIDGRAVATWRLDRGRVRLQALEPIRPADVDALAEDAGRVLSYLGMPPAPLEILDAP
ncbi:MAG: hypothetical protein QOE37_1465 [Microbacteriaceae bacterium]|nr:hypothetical protein [Microbacteriaceae bacterium]